MRLSLKRLRNKFINSNARYCPVCEHQFSTFYPLPVAYIRNWARYGFPYKAAQFETLNFKEFSCPICGSTDRDRLFTFYLKNFKDKRLSILDIAPSKSLSSYIRKHLGAHYITADLFMEGVDLRLNIEKMDSIDNDQYDLVICSHVLEHVPDDIAALKEIRRVLKPGGKAILMVPIVKDLDVIIEDPKETSVEVRWKKFGQDDHIRLYSAGGWTNRVLQSGLELETLIAKNIIDNPEFNGIDPDSVLYIASKSQP